MGTIAFSPGNVSSSRHRAKRCCYKLSVGRSGGPLPQHTSGESTHCIHSRGFSSPTINGDNLSCQCPRALGVLPSAGSAFFPAAPCPVAGHLWLPGRGKWGCPWQGALAVGACQWAGLFLCRERRPVQPLVFLRTSLDLELVTNSKGFRGPGRSHT